MAERPASHPDPCTRAFPEELLSGHLDGALTQAEEQRVRVHLEDCAVCRHIYDELRALREATMSTRFPTPPDDQWDERPRGGLSRLFRGTGWLLVGLWLVVAAAFALYEFVTAPGEALVKVIVFTGLTGVALLFLSILIDRLRTLPGDRYRRVQK